MMAFKIKWMFVFTFAEVVFGPVEISGEFNLVVEVYPQIRHILLIEYRLPFHTAPIRISSKHLASQ